EIFRERARAIHADADGVAAEMAPTCAAVAAVTAGDMPFTGDAIANRETAHFAADFDDLADILVAHGHRHRDGLLRPGIPFVDMHVGAADRGLRDLDQYIVRADLRLRNVRHPDPGRGFFLDECFHVQAFNTPSSRPAVVNASIALSSW